MEGYTDADVREHLSERYLASGTGLHQALTELRRQMIIDALKMCGGNQSRAAELLQIHRNRVADWIIELGIDPNCYIRRRSLRELTESGLKLRKERSANNDDNREIRRVPDVPPYDPTDQK